MARKPKLPNLLDRKIYKTGQTRGVKFGAKRKYDQFQIAEIIKKRKAGEGYGSIAKSLGMKKSTVQSIIQREVAA